MNGIREAKFHESEIKSPVDFWRKEPRSESEGKQTKANELPAELVEPETVTNGSVKKKK